ncbi:hypothetical protein LguiA_017637 [Lonicera macranthoides]
MANRNRNFVKLKGIMQTILSLGNALNHGTARGTEHRVAPAWLEDGPPIVAHG